MHVLKLHDPFLLSELQAIVYRFFPEETGYYCRMPADEYREIVARAQAKMNERGFVKKLIDDTMFCGVGEYLAQSLHLRAARPVKGNEAVGWHRENFYGTPEGAYNFWMPVMNVTPDNALRYILGSEKIPDEQIELVQTQDHERGSFSHQIGLPYAPKHIVGGVDFSAAIPVPCSEGSAVVFDGNVIHGAAINKTDKIRFSVDFRMIAKERLCSSGKADSTAQFAAFTIT